MAKKNLGKEGEEKIVPEAVRAVFDVNVKGTVAVLTAMNDLMRPAGRMVVISSMAIAFVLRKTSEENRKRVTSPDMKTPDLIKAIDRYAGEVEAGTHTDKGWPADDNYCYPFSCFCLAKMVCIFRRRWIRTAEI